MGAPSSMRSPSRGLALLGLVAMRVSADAPSQLWLNYGPTPDTMVVTWTSSNLTDHVYWAPVSGGPYAASDDPELLTYSSPPVEGIQDDVYTSGLIHRVTLTGLVPGTRAYYRIGAPDAWTAERSFLAHPGVGPSVPMKMLLLADMDYSCFDGKRCNPEAVVARLSTPGVLDDVTGGAVFAGDLAYANGNQTHWDGYQEFMSPVASQIPIMTNAGNHEMSNGERGLLVRVRTRPSLPLGDAPTAHSPPERSRITEPLFLPFKTRFGGMPYAAPENVDSGALFYSYNVGSLHVIVLCAYSDVSDSSPQTVSGRTPWEPQGTSHSERECIVPAVTRRCPQCAADLPSERSQSGQPHADPLGDVRVAPAVVQQVRRWGRCAEGRRGRD